MSDEIKTDLRALIRANPQTAARALVDYQRRLRLRFENKYSEGISTFFSAIGTMLLCLDRAEASVVALPKGQAAPQVMTFLLVHRCADDLLAGFELFTCGLLYAAKNMLRSASEAYATAVLVSFDRQIFELYHKGHWDVSASLNKLRRRKDLPVPIEAVDSIIAAYSEWSKNVHPTFAGIRELSPKKGSFVGGLFHEDTDSAYRTFLGNSKGIALSMANFLDVRFIQANNPLHVHQRR
jgi:hypothetical protein